ncbi:MAG: Txe/YoeB family addiction module toxin [Bacteroidetes bacterium]|nr:Txe/YoeB family addiction module toxin [Bacteroidota bacterium]
MRPVIFASQAKADYENRAKKDKKTHQKIILLIRDIDRSPFTGIGKPEPLKYQLAGFWSRRINNKDRLVYQISPGDEIVIASCKGHYSK